MADLRRQLDNERARGEEQVSLHSSSQSLFELLLWVVWRLNIVHKVDEDVSHASLV